MATETKRIIEVDTGDSVKSINDLKSEISELKKQLDNCVVGSEDAAKASQDLAQAQAKLSAATKGAITSSGELNNSYNGLVAQMAKLKAEWKATTDEAKRADLSKQIDGLNDKLKDMDASVGTFSRNVGNYQYAFEALGQKGAGALIGGLKGIKGGMDALKSHPLIAIAAIAISFFMKLVDRMKKNEEAMKSLTKAMYPIKAVADVIMSAFDSMATAVADALNWLIEQVEKMASWIGVSFGRIATKALKLEKELAETEINIAANHRKYLLENAQLEQDAYALKAKIADKEKYTNEERIAYMEAYNEKRKQIAANELAEAKEQLKLLKLKSETGAQSKEDLNKLAEAEAKVIQLQTRYNETLNETNAEMSQLKKSIADESNAAAKEAIAAQNKLIDSLNNWDSNRTKEGKLAALKKQYDANLKLLGNNLEAKKKLEEKYQQDVMDIEKQYSKERTALEESLNKWKSNQSEQGKLDALKAQYDTELALLGDNLEAKILLEEKYQQDVAAIKKEYSDKATAEKAAKDKEEADAEQKKIDDKYAQLAQTQEVFSNYSSTLDGQLGAVSTFISGLESATLDLAKSLESGKKSWVAYGKMASAALSGAASMMSALASQQDATSEEGFEEQKKYQIAAATMNMLGGIVSSIAGIPEYISMFSALMAGAPAAGIALGTANAAMIGAMGAAQIAQIAKTQFGGSGSASSASANVSTAALTSITAPVQYTSDVQGASTETEVQDTRVYVVESDITGVQNKVSTAESESRF